MRNPKLAPKIFSCLCTFDTRKTYVIAQIFGRMFYDGVNSRDFGNNMDGSNTRDGINSWDANNSRYTKIK